MELGYLLAIDYTAGVIAMGGTGLALWIMWATRRWP